MTHYLERMLYYQPELTQALIETGYMVIVSFFAALLLGLPLGTMIYLSRKQENTTHKWLYRFGNGYVNIVRSFPFLLFVVALIPVTRIVIGTAFGTIAASFPLAFVSIALYSRLVEQVLLDVPEGVIALGHALGATTRQFIFRFLYVEARSGLVLSMTSVMISMVSYSTIMGVVGGGGIGDFAIRYGYQRYEYDVMYTTIVLMIVLVMGIQYMGTSIARKLDKRK